jgi:protein SCO1/2
MQELYESFRGSDDVRFLSISVDPERDTLEVLRDYADSLGVDDERWLFARGPIEDVVALSEKGFLLAAANLPMGHSTRFALVDRDGGIRGYYDSRDEASLKTLKNELRGLVRSEG